ncbi:hypothetical protein L198_06247 [Cryptococcus wingfieldii CBS 7118]|uniref:Uncharacterized protein n=1 Tax=Cryptococcus wingfieldii CBS 7118 TaxID=1295528 RepID=A0A1E3INQ2_9TREE|nr:hypothetical protein L198_06247 [Cryptococcus wingfieldii CBS 7118]ODN90229.1 hypothetical protein L198_06247 [Cryptococcus wingfieldii CBS 7118]
MNPPALFQTLGSHFPRTINENQELINKVDWLVSSRKSSIAISRCYREALSGQSEEVAELKEQILALQQVVSTLNGGEGRKRKRGKAQTWEKNSDIESWVHAGVRRLLGMPETGSKDNFAPEKWPDYDKEEATNGYIQTSEGRALWRPDWGNLKNRFFENLVEAAIKSCLDNQAILEKAKVARPSEVEVRDRVVMYLESIDRKKGNAASVETEWKKIDGRTRSLVKFIKDKWDDLPLSKCREAPLLKAALTEYNGVLRTLYFIEWHETQNPLKVAENVAEDGENIDDLEDAELDDYDDIVEPWWWSEVIRLAVWTAFELWQQSIKRGGRPSVDVFHLPPNYHKLRTTGFRLASGVCAEIEEGEGGGEEIIQPRIKCTKSMINWDVVRPVNSPLIPDESQIPGDVVSATSRHLPTLQQYLLNTQPGILTKVTDKHLKLPPCVESHCLRSMWKGRRRHDGVPYHMKINAARQGERFDNLQEFHEQESASTDRRGRVVWPTDGDAFNDYSDVGFGDVGDFRLDDDGDEDPPLPPTQE